MAQRDVLCASAEQVGFDLVLRTTFEDLDEGFRDANREILAQHRGAGFWIWKPQIILQTLEKLQAHDVLLYSDAGKNSYYNCRRLPALLMKQARDKGFLTGVQVGQHGPLSRWTKRDAMILTNMDRVDIHLRPQIQATWSLWTPCDEAFRFLKIWRDTCEDARCSTDMPNVLGIENLMDFKDHRHDQAICTLLTYRENAPFLSYENSLAMKLLTLRPQSRLANYFFKRFEDAEALEEGWTFRALVRAQRALNNDVQRVT